MLNKDILALIFNYLTYVDRRQCRLVCKLFEQIIHQHRLPTLTYNLYDAARYHDDYSFISCCKYVITKGKHHIIEGAFTLFDEHLIRLLFDSFRGDHQLHRIFIMKMKHVMKYELTYIAEFIKAIYDNSGILDINEHICGKFANERRCKRGQFDGRVSGRNTSFSVTEEMCVWAYLYHDEEAMEVFMADIEYQYQLLQWDGFHTFKNTCLALSVIDDHNAFLTALEDDVNVQYIIEHIVKRDDVTLFSKLPAKCVDRRNHAPIYAMVGKYVAVKIYIHIVIKYNVTIVMKWHRITLEQYKSISLLSLPIRTIAECSHNNDIIDWYNKHHNDTIEYVDVRTETQ